MTTRLRHRTHAEEEDASALKLGAGACNSIDVSTVFDGLTVISAEFNNAGCLLISEVKYLLENRDKDAPDTAYVPAIALCRLLEVNPFSVPDLDSVYNKTLEYVKTFAKFSTTDSASAVRE
ncbi:hypothetical protein J3R82DRAFT_2470 [Butyriboletus roseoflavus]|nr:hypothetical protein J3R82DRAFT_2470 [Butyriboletus roseoflavus]